MNNLKKIIIAASFFSLSSIGAYAQSDYYGASPFEGFYAGAYAGGTINPAMATTVGGIAGVNYAVTDSIVAGVEAQGGVSLDDTTSYDALMLGRLGFEASDTLLVYGAAGAGLLEGETSYVVGGGVEALVTTQVGVRAEAFATGEWGEEVSGTKMSLGALWHMK